MEVGLSYGLTVCCVAVFTVISIRVLLGTTIITVGGGLFVAACVGAAVGDGHDALLKIMIFVGVLLIFVGMVLEEPKTRVA